MRMAVLRISPARVLLFGYLSYMILGWAALSLPWAQKVDVSALDALFIATSAVSTTGLVTVDPGTSFTYFGQGIVLLLIQLGGLGYMTIGSFATLAVQRRLSGVQVQTARATFNLPKEVHPALFIRAVIVFTFLTEALGAVALYVIFVSEGVANPVWSAIFHAISAFCTAGFSLNPNSFEGFADHAFLNIVISALSIAGAMGFLIVVDVWRKAMGRKTALGFTSKVIWRITMMFLVLGTLFLYVAEPSIRSLPTAERLMAAFFQVMTASTTVGFNTVPIGGLSLAVLVCLLFLMVVGASPAGTGGGLKTTSFAALVGLVRSTLKGRDEIQFAGQKVGLESLQVAAASLAYYLALLFVVLTLLCLTEVGHTFEAILFEAISALGTVGLSTGLTGDLSDIGKLLVILLMTAGRVGILTFGVALATRDDAEAEETDEELVV